MEQSPRDGGRSLSIYGHAMPAVAMLLALMCCVSLVAQDAVPATPETPQLPLAWPPVDAEERKIIDGLAAGKEWHYRAFALMRLERFAGAEVDDRLRAALTDVDWHVRCFALLGCARRGIALPPEALAKEVEPHVLLTALRLGHAVGPAQVRAAVKTLRAAADADAQMLAAEVAVASRDRELTRACLQGLAGFIKRMSDGDALLHGWRMRRVLGLGDTDPGKGGPSPSEGWRAWLQQAGATFELPKEDLALAPLRTAPVPRVAAMTPAEFRELSFYLDGLDRRDMELAVLVDATGSMGGILREAQEQVNRLMLVLEQFSRAFRVAFVAYRDHDDRKTIEATPLTADVAAVRRFLVSVVAEGGGDLPESVWSAFEHVLTSTKWSRMATRQIVVIGDAPSRAEEEAKVVDAIRGLGRNGFRVHLVAVGGSPDCFAALAPAVTGTGGSSVTKRADDELARLIIRLSFEEALAKAFDDFYERFVRLCL